jgi:putative ABC transport system permease protein
VDSGLIEQIIRTGSALVLMTAAALVVFRLGALKLKGEFLISAVRALVQLTLVALVIAWIFQHPEGAYAYLALMLVAAAWTATRRIGGDRRDFLLTLLAIAIGAGATISIVLITGALPRTAQSMLPFSAQMIGGAMAASALAGLRLRDDIRTNWNEFEGYLALGATVHRAGREFANRATQRSLVPALDQTKSAGLVTLPGAFVGLLLGGASPALAAQIQLLVLLGLLLAQALTALLVTRWVSPIDRLPPFVVTK